MFFCEFGGVCMEPVAIKGRRCDAHDGQADPRPIGLDHNVEMEIRAQRRENAELRADIERLREEVAVLGASRVSITNQLVVAEAARDAAQAKLAWIDDHLRWADATFVNVSDVSTLRHLELELDELAEQPDAIVEAADIGLILMHHVHRKGRDLFDEMRRKSLMCRERTFDPTTGETAGKVTKLTRRDAAQAKLAALCGLTISPDIEIGDVWIQVPNAMLRVGAIIDRSGPVVAKALTAWRTAVLAAAQAEKENADGAR